MTTREKTAQTMAALEKVAKQYARHSGPNSTASERELFSSDLGVAALRYARAYYAETRELGLIHADSATETTS